jgi:single-strand selective monofunctional uracil DNA glycosylase
LRHRPRVRQRVVPLIAAMSLVEISRALSKAVRKLEFGEPVTHVYNPLEYARAPHEAYLTRYGSGPKEVLLVGMNPGPFGMAQTGVPFGDVALVREFLGIDGKVERPRQEHPARPVLGFELSRGEVSGQRLWGFARDKFGTSERFFERFFVHNYCPLAFLETSGKNRTPDKLPKGEQEALFSACDGALARVVEVLRPKLVVGVGAFAEKRARIALAKSDVRVATILHPSPASPKANAGWARLASEELAALGISIP